MFSLPATWELASLLAKLLLYMGAASIAGGILVAWRYSSSNRSVLAFNFSYILVGSVIGFQGVLLGFLIQIGLINDSGISGMFDWGMSSIMLDTALGDITFMRLLAFVLAAASSLYLLKKIQNTGLSLASMAVRHTLFLLLLALFLIAYSHRMIGHVSVLGTIAQISVVLHFLAFSAWIGCFIPFLQLSQDSDIETLRYALKRFGDNAVVVLLVLFVSGGYMLLELLHSAMELVTTAYGVALMVKFVLVLAILCVAALNKLYLVPALGKENSVAKLQRSIRYETCLAFFILLITSFLSTVIGPAAH